MPENQEKRKPQLNLQTLMKIGIALCFAVGIGLLAWYLVMAGRKEKEAQVQESLKDLYYTDADATEKDEATPTPTITSEPEKSEEAEQGGETPAPEPTATPRVMAEKFLKLYETNPDVIGWVKAGDQVDGPVVQRDNTYYLHTDFYGDKNNHGTIMMDEANGNFETDVYRILYGHQFSDGTMFSGLKKYNKLSYLQTYPLVEFHTLYEQEPGQYVIFSVFDASVSQMDGRQYIHLRCFEEYRNNMEFREEYLADLKERSWHDIPVEVSGEDQILCLVTCAYNDRNGRLMVFCRKLRDGETADAMAELMAEAKEK